MIEKPMKFKGKHKKNKYFEGWYYKFVSKDESTTLSLIPGVSINRKNPHAFIQVIYKSLDTVTTKYLTYDIKEFNYDYQSNTVWIKNNKFNLSEIELSYEDLDFNVYVSLQINNLIPIRTTVVKPSIMGFFHYLPFMECKHDVVSMNHEVIGEINFNGIEKDFTKGKGYIEKDFGKSFPISYVWIQSNNFTNNSASIMFSYAKIPYLGLRFNGFIINFIFNNKEYRFATYNFSRTKLKFKSENQVVFEVKKRGYRLIVDATNSKTVALASPKEGLMDHYIKEGLSGEVKVTLYKRNKLLFDEMGKNAGIEIML